MKKLHLVINPNAGTRRGRRLLPDFVDAFNRAGYLCTVFSTEKRGDAVEYTREQTGDADLVVVCGGDGTLNEVITGLLQAGRSVPLGYIPCGSTNDFAAGLGIPRQPLQAVRSMRALAVALGRYKFHVGEYPSDAEGLNAIAAKAWLRQRSSSPSP